MFLVSNQFEIEAEHVNADNISMDISDVTDVTDNAAQRTRTQVHIHSVVFIFYSIWEYLHICLLKSITKKVFSVRLP